MDYCLRSEYEIPLSTGKVLRMGRRTLLMGVLNITPDSFSDGGQFLTPEHAVDRGIQLEKEGADIVDVGGESTRPGAEPVPVRTELERIIPVIEALRQRISIPISVDTYKAEVAKEALLKGAEIINDVSSLRFDSHMPDVAKENDATVILMHMRGTPKTMHTLDPSDDILAEIARDLDRDVTNAKSSGIKSSRIIIDPGIGFGKNTDENLRILNCLHVLNRIHHPILVGPSRKSFIGNILGLPISQRMMGTAGTVAVSILRGAHIIRVHDVKPIRELATMIDATLNTMRDGAQC